MYTFPLSLFINVLSFSYTRMLWEQNELCLNIWRCIPTRPPFLCTINHNLPPSTTHPKPHRADSFRSRSPPSRAIIKSWKRFCNTNRGPSTLRSRRYVSHDNRELPLYIYIIIFLCMIVENRKQTKHHQCIVYYFCVCILTLDNWCTCKTFFEECLSSYFCVCTVLLKTFYFFSLLNTNPESSFLKHNFTDTHCAPLFCPTKTHLQSV